MGRMRERCDNVDLGDLREGIRKLEAYRQKVNQNVNKTGYKEEKGVNQDSTNSLNLLGAEGGTRTPTRTTPH